MSASPIGGRRGGMVGARMHPLPVGPWAPPSILRPFVPRAGGTPPAPPRSAPNGATPNATVTWWGLAACAVLLAVALQLRQIPESVVVSAPLPRVPERSHALLAPFTIGGVAANRNRLVVTIVNASNVPLPEHLMVSVDGGPPYAVPAAQRPAPGAMATVLLANEVVQRRAPVTIEVRTADGRAVQTLSAIVAPDTRNDLELAGAHVDADGVLIAEVRNHSPIPLRGHAALAAREPGFPYTLLAATDAPFDIAAGGSQLVPVGHVGTIDLARTWIGLTTDAIDDADIANDTYRP